MARPKGGYDLGGEPVVGTTTICGMLAKPALVGWAGKTCTELAWRVGRLGEPMPRWNDLLYGPRDDAATAGTLVHECFEAHLRGLPIPVLPDDDVGRAARQGFENAQHWLSASALEVEPFERPLVSATHRYGGTPDAIARMNGSTFLADWKTGGVYVDMLLQMAAYRHLLHECAGIETKGVHLVRFHREFGDFTHHFIGDDALDRGWVVFRNLLEAYPLIRELEARVK